MATIYATLINQSKFNYHLFSSASFYKIIEENQLSDETELIITLDFNQKLTESDTDKIEVKLQFKHQIQIQETK